MSLFGALFTGVSALGAQSQSIAIISNNIANVNTVGYKRIEASFESIVTSGGGATIYSPGSVLANRTNTIDLQGNISQSSSPTDIAITGNGFFITRTSSDATTEPVYTRAGSFAEDSDGFLRNSAGNYLYGWPLDANGNIPTANADLSSLTAVSVSFTGGLTRPTSSAAVALNLNANETNNSYPFTGTETVDFSRGLRVYDSLGSAQDITINYRKSESPASFVTGNVDLSSETNLVDLAGISDGDAINITVGGVGPTAITIDDGDSTVDLVAKINNNVDGVIASLDSSGFLNISVENTGEDLVLADAGGGTILASSALGLSAGTTTAPAVPDVPVTLENSPNPFGWWNVEVLDPNGATLVNTFVNFNSDGSINGEADIDGNVKFDINDISWGNGSDPQDIELDITNFTQFSGEYNVVSVSQNGAELGLRTSVSIDEEGYLVANFSNGQSTRIYQLALATFANPNGLDEVSGNGYIQTNNSGDFNLRIPGDGGSGLIQGGTLEASNVDLASEFSNMIVTQRAYSAGTRVISTADEMTEELLRLR